MIRACAAHGVCDPREMTRDDLEVELYVCHKKIEELKAQAPHLRHLHLKQCLQHARESGDEKALKDIKRIMRHEATRKRYGRMKRSTKPKQGGAVYSVRVPANTSAETQEFNTKDGIFGCVSTHLSERFCLAFTASSYSGNLFDGIGFIRDPAAATAILEGTYEFPPDTDPATMLLLDEAAITYALIPPEEVATYVTVKDSTTGNVPMREFHPPSLGFTLGITSQLPLILICLPCTWLNSRCAPKWAFLLPVGGLV